MRMPISAIAVSAQWLSQFLVGQVTPPGTANLGNRYWIIYAVLNACFIPLVYLFFPETNGRSLEEIDQVFEHSTVLTVVRHAKELPRESRLDFSTVEEKYKPHVEFASSSGPHPSEEKSSTVFDHTNTR